MATNVPIDSTVPSSEINSTTLPMSKISSARNQECKDSPQSVISTETATKGNANKNTSVAKARKISTVSRKLSKADRRLQLQRRRIKVAGAPKMPLTGYVRYMASRREQLRQQFPEKTSIEYTKIIGEEWTALSDDKKKPFLKEAETDRQRYFKELNEFLKSRPDILTSELAKNKIRKRKENIPRSILAEKAQTNGNSNNVNGTSTKMKSSPPSSLNENTSLGATKNSKQNLESPANKMNRRSTPSEGISQKCGDIPIFTDEFLEHNRCVDMELKSLRKSFIDFEMQNSILEKHVENMKLGVEKMTTENDDLQEKNRLLESYLDKLRAKLAQALSGLPIPSEPNGATVDNIDKYMNDLHKMATSNNHGPATLNKARDIIRKLDLTIQL